MWCDKQDLNFETQVRVQEFELNVEPVGWVLAAEPITPPARQPAGSNSV